MGYRDPRILSERLDNNIINPPQAPPEAETSPEADAIANATKYPGGYASAQRINPTPAAPSQEQDPGGDYYPSPRVQYPTAGHDWNVTRGPDDRDDAGAPTKNRQLLDARGYTSGKNQGGGPTGMGTKPKFSGDVR